MNRIDAPFTPEQVAYLVDWQANSTVHPYTCPIDDIDLEAHAETNVGNETKLVPSKLGLRCPGCGFSQRWAFVP